MSSVGEMQMVRARVAVTTGILECARSEAVDSCTKMRVDQSRPARLR